MSSDTKSAGTSDSLLRTRRRIRLSILAFAIAGMAIAGMTLRGGKQDVPLATSSNPPPVVEPSASTEPIATTLPAITASAVVRSTPEVLPTPDAALDSQGGSASASGETTVGYLSGVVLDGAGHPVPRARVTALRHVEDRCPSSAYADHCFGEVDADEGARERCDAFGEFALFGLQNGTSYDLFVDLQGEDVWWITACATPIALVAAPQKGLRLTLPYGILEVKIALPPELSCVKDARDSMNLQLHVQRGVNDESVANDVGDSIRVAVAFDEPVDLELAGRGMAKLVQKGVAVARSVGTAELTFRIESTGFAQRLSVSVVDPNGDPVPDVWIYEIASFDPPRFETLRSASDSDRDNGLFAFDLLEARQHTILAMPDSDGEFAPTGTVIDLPASASREVLFAVTPGEFSEVRVPNDLRDVKLIDLSAPDLDFDIGRAVEWVEAGGSSWERVKTLAAGKTYRTTFRLPVGRFVLRYSVEGVAKTARFEVVQGHRTRIDLGASR